MSLALETRPAWTGSTFSARLAMPAMLKLENIAAKLQYTRVDRVEESDGTSFRKKVDLEAPGRVETSLDGPDQCNADISVDVPPNSPETSWVREELTGWWDLVVEMRVEGIDVRLLYEVPVSNPERYPTLS